MARLTLAAVLAWLALAIAPSAASAAPPERLDTQVTDDAGAFDSGERARVEAAVDRLYDTHRLRLWVVYVNDFSGQTGAMWATDTATRSALGERDVLLAVATTVREYQVFSPSLPGEVSDAELRDLRVDAIEPALRDQRWADAAIAAANGLGESMDAEGGASARTLLIGGAVLVVGAGGVMLYSRKKKRERAKAGIEAARDVDPNDTAALAALPVAALDERSREVLVEMDNAVKTSAEELELARGEFGDAQTRPFTTAFDAAKQALAAAFAIRQRLDDAVPETPEQQRDLLVELISGCGRADRELDARVAEFDAMRDLLIDAPSRLDGLTEQLVALTSRLPDAEAALARLVGEFPAEALAPVRDNVTQAKDRLAFADTAIADGRAAVARPAGEQGPAVAAIRAAEGAVGQARTLLDAVDNAADDIRAAITALPAAIEDTRKDLRSADDLAAHGGEVLATAQRAAEAALAKAEAAKDTNPLGAFTDLAAADTALDTALAGALTERQRAERMAQQLEQALSTASAQVNAATDFIATRRGAVQAQARTRLSEAQRHLEEATRSRDTDPPSALRHAQTAAELGAQAASLAERDVREWEQRSAPSPFGGSSGAVLGGILLDSVLRGGFGSGSRGGRWSGGGGPGPGSFGGAGSSRRIGGGGRF